MVCLASDLASQAWGVIHIAMHDGYAGRAENEGEPCGGSWVGVGQIA